MQIHKIRGRSLVVGAVLTALTIVTSACSGASQVAQVLAESPEPSPLPWILFQQAGQRIEVAMVHPDGSGRVTPFADLPGGHQSNPDWSPDGQQVVFAMSDGDRDDLWVADLDGSNARMLLDCRGRCRWLDDPDWSPDGTEIVYSRTIERADGWGIGTLETVDVDTGKVRVVLGPWKREFTAGARYSPDGSHVVFERVHKTGRGPDADVDAVTLSTVRLDRGRVVRALTDPRLFAATADWSPDGARIVYTALVAPDQDAQELFWIAPTGGTPTQITHVGESGGYAVEPAWLPDGSGVVFSGSVDSTAGSGELLKVQVDGTGLGPAVEGPSVYGRHPRVQPTP